MSLIGEMARTYKGDRRPREKNLKIRDRRMRELVRYAREHSPFYRELYANVPEDFELSDLPPVTKPQMMASFDDVLTDREITMKKIESFTCDPDNIGRKIDGKYLVFKTSGSTGVPAVILYDDQAIDVSSAVAAFVLSRGKKTSSPS